MDSRFRGNDKKETDPNPAKISQKNKTFLHQFFHNTKRLNNFSDFQKIAC
ncbi:hypothetical protein A11S_689 [Micavibrio aeruginosavorus EPB]|uniref:Uncharacterized protein n=1 Tax=Micavibrio aeruginosavorus EPB TaxID=349215 RepID=M4VE85_9BACT|nr:hypothetical protein A11S_689 [Micavibrio aeruginosavorus EPB]